MQTMIFPTFLRLVEPQVAIDCHASCYYLHTVNAGFSFSERCSQHAHAIYSRVYTRSFSDGLWNVHNELGHVLFYFPQPAEDRFLYTGPVSIDYRYISIYPYESSAKCETTGERCANCLPQCSAASRESFRLFTNCLSSALPICSLDYTRVVGSSAWKPNGQKQNIWGIDLQRDGLNK